MRLGFSIRSLNLNGVLFALKEYLAGKTSTKITGTVAYQADHPDGARRGQQEPTPMKGVSITIAGLGGTFRSKTDPSGQYSISGLPPGSYEANAELAGYRKTWGPDQIQLASKGCAVDDMLMGIDRRVQGIVRSADGDPVAGALVEMIPTHPHANRWENPILLTESDESGFYTIEGIPPGDYYLGINVNSTPTKDHPYAPTYYPNTHDPKTAIPITFLTNSSVLYYDLIAPAKLNVIRVRGRISDAAGRPPLDPPQVRIKEPALYGQIETETVTVDAEGRFEIELCEGVRYSAYGFSGPLKNAIYSEPMEFAAGETELRFVLNKTSQEFNQLSREFRGQ